MTTTRFRHQLVILAGAAAIGMGVAPLPARADLISTETIAPQSSVAGKRDHVKATMARPELAKKMSALGVSPDEIQGRIDAMTDREIVALSDRIDTLPAGGLSDQNWLLVIIAVLLLVIAL